jgi:NTE family protein
MNQQGKSAKTPPEVAFVLSGGAALGASQVGMLRALLERGIKPDLIVGTSIGSWNGLWLAAHPELEWLDMLEEVWHSITLLELFGDNVISFVAHRASKRPYLVSGDGMERIYRRAVALGGIQDVTFEELSIPFKVTASNILRGTSETFDSGPVMPAVLASSSIPGLFPPRMIDGQQYVDGGLLDNGGVGVAVEAGAKRIYVLNVMSAEELTQPVTTLTDLMVRSFHLISSSHVNKAVRRYADQVEFIVLEDHASARANSLDFRHSRTLIADGYTAATKKLDEHERLMVARAALLAEASHAAHALQESPREDLLTHWLQQPATQNAFQALAKVDLRVKERWHQINDWFSGSRDKLSTSLPRRSA